MTHGTREVLLALDRLENALQRDGDQIAQEFVHSTRREMFATDSIETGRMVASVEYLEQFVSDGQHYQIGAFGDMDVTYDGFVETDGITRNWIGRRNYEGGIRNARLEPIFDQMMNSSFVV